MTAITKDETEEYAKTEYPMLTDGELVVLYNECKIEGDKEGRIDSDKFKEKADKIKKDMEHEQEIKEEALRIYKSGEALDFMCEGVAKIHAGDEGIIKSMFLSFASTLVDNCDGSNVSVNGSAGSGKTHVAESTAKFIPGEYIFNKGMSDKAIYRANLKSGQIIIFNDRDLSPEMQNILKNMSWHHPTEYEAADKNNQKQNVPYSIPEKIPYFELKVEGSGDEQIRNRELVFWADDDAEHIKQRDELMDKILAKPSLRKAANHDIEVSKAIWWIIINGGVRDVAITFKITGGNNEVRTRSIFTTLIQASCIMDASNRKCDEDGSLIATAKDFVVAAEIINPLMQRKGGDMSLKLNRDADRLISGLMTLETGDYPRSDIMIITGLSDVQLSQALNGRKTDHSDGAIAKVPGLTQFTINHTIYASIADEKNVKVTHSKYAIHWDKEAYQKAIDKSKPFKMNGMDLDEVKGMLTQTNPIPS